jgi:hypothetical protein
MFGDLIAVVGAGSGFGSPFLAKEGVGDARGWSREELGEVVEVVRVPGLPYSLRVG